MFNELLSLYEMDHFGKNYAIFNRGALWYSQIILRTINIQYFQLHVFKFICTFQIVYNVFFSKIVEVFQNCGSFSPNSSEQCSEHTNVAAVPIFCSTLNLIHS